ncbi:hypothetical protein GGI1_23726 [Acidithiobacillus sp. GGI-221]|nr:hypothetical protein GGI1_23726 [Acidithiobacillus sp. GGI-221]
MKTTIVIFDGEIVAPMGYASSKISKKDRERNTSYQALPTMAGHFIIPGEQLAGALRRAGMDDFRNAFDDEPVTSILSYYQARVGGIAGFGKTYKAGEMADLRRKNPFLSLWGKAGMAGHLGMGHAIGPATEIVQSTIGNDGQTSSWKRFHVDRVQGFRADDLARNPETEVPVSFWRDREVLKFAGKSLENTKVLGKWMEESGNILDFPVPFEAAEGDDAKTGEKKTEDTGKLTNIQNGFGGFEYLPNETRFAHRFTVSGTEAEILMLMGSFNGFARQPRLGGHWRNNLGWVDMRYTAYIREDDPRELPREVGTMTIRSQLSALELDAPAIETTGTVDTWMKDYLAVRAAGFPNIDINAGVEDEERIIRHALKAAARPKGGRDKPVEKDDATADAVDAEDGGEVDHVA